MIETALAKPTESTCTPKLWMPERVIFTPAALDEAHGQQILQRLQALNLPIEYAKSNRITDVRGATERETYNRAKRTLAVVNAPAGQLKLQPIPPSADWQFHLAQGCPAHCQYCYLAGSLSGPPLVRVYANLPQILDNLAQYESEDETSYEVSCYTDPLALEHLTGSLSECIKYFGTRENGFLRWVSKFDNVDDLLNLSHNGQTRCRFSVNVAEISSRLEGGTSSVAARIGAARKLANAGYPIGFVVAPIMPVENWQDEYSDLLTTIAREIPSDADVTFELITHRFTPGSKDVLLSWYPKTKLDLEESGRSEKRNKFGGVKYVYPRDVMKELKSWFESEIARQMPNGKILYWT